MRDIEIFRIPFKGKYIIYAPLKRLAFVGNAKLAFLIALLLSGKKPNQPSEEVSQAIEFIENSGLLSSDSVLINQKTTYHYQPISVTLFLTNRCNLRCAYCYASGGEMPPVDMSFDLAKQAIDIVCNNAINRRYHSFDLGFHGGGEPTLNWDILTKAIAHARRKPIHANISASSNGCYTRDKLEYILENFNSLSLSFDGPPDIQNIQRPFANGVYSFPVVMKTIKAMDRRSFPYGIRATVTAFSAGKIDLIVDFLCRNTDTKLIQVEPVFSGGRGNELVVSAETAEIFIKSFQEAYELAASKGVKLIYSGARLDTITTQFCFAPCDSLVVLQTGEVSTCFEIHNVNHPLAQDFIFGRIRDRKLSFDEEKWRKTVSRNVQEIPYCHNCFCKFHCAGDCIARTFSSRNASHFKPSVRCKINRELTKYLILKKISQGNGFWVGESGG